MDRVGNLFDLRIIQHREHDEGRRAAGNLPMQQTDQAKAGEGGPMSGALALDGVEVYQDAINTGPAGLVDDVLP